MSYYSDNNYYLFTGIQVWSMYKQRPQQTSRALYLRWEFLPSCLHPLRSMEQDTLLWVPLHVSYSSMYVIYVTFLSVIHLEPVWDTCLPSVIHPSAYTTQAYIQSPEWVCMSINNLEGYSVLERHSSPLTSTTVDYCALLFLLLSPTWTLKSLP